MHVPGCEVSHVLWLYIPEGEVWAVCGLCSRLSDVCYLTWIFASTFCFVVSPHPRIFFPLIFRESGKEQGREGRYIYIYINVRQTHPTCTSTGARDQTCNPGMYPGLEIEPMTSSAQASALITDPCWPGHKHSLVCWDICHEVKFLSAKAYIYGMWDFWAGPGCIFQDERPLICLWVHAPHWQLWDMFLGGSLFVGVHPRIWAVWSPWACTPQDFRYLYLSAALTSLWGL